MYKEFIKEYLELGHMTEVSCAENQLTTSEYYLPHHFVLKPDSSTTKLRVVFDASAKSSTNISLNDCLLIGPKTQDDLLSIVLRFRLYKYVFTADITKMYRQIKVHHNDRPFQRIVWKEHSHDRIRSFELNTVTYGTACAPYLATKCLVQLAKNGKCKYPKGSAVLSSDFYVDDLLSGSNSVEEAIQTQKELIDLLSEGGFELRKWSSNSQAIIKGIPEGLKESSTTAQQTIRTLGIRWNIEEDTFIYEIDYLLQNHRATKRNILSDIAKMYDPLGLIGPIVFTAKLLMQKLWQNGYDWDSDVTGEIYSEWMKFRSDLMNLSINIKRRVTLDSADSEIHGFCDASEKGYGACIYVRSNFGNYSQMNLLCSKSRVVPFRKYTIPKLELCAAQLLVKLMLKVKESIEINQFSKIAMWSDSQIVLSWIRKPARKKVRKKTCLVTAIETINPIFERFSNVRKIQRIFAYVYRFFIKCKFRNSGIKVINISPNRLDRWQYIQLKQQQIWNRFYNEYISSLQIRKKWFKKLKITEGMLVLIKEDNLPPMKWKLGRITRVHPGKDNITRVVTIKTKDGNLQRAISKIAILPIQDKSEQIVHLSN